MENSQKRKKIKVVIIGGVAAGTCAAVKARRTSEDAEIVLYEKYKYVSYATCGLPYFVSGKIAEAENLVINNVSLLEKRFNLKINILHEVVKIDPSNKTILVKDLRNNNKFEDNYDKLVIATGTKPLLINKEFEDANNVFYLRTIDDGLKLKAKINLIKNELIDLNHGYSEHEDVILDNLKIPNAVIIGGGYIGLELLDAFISNGFKVTIIEMADQILPAFDYEIIEYLENYLKDKGVILLKNQEVSNLEKDSSGKIVKIETNKGAELPVDLVFIGAGAKPDTDIAKECGIEIGNSGAIIVNEFMQTSIPDIYAAGDCCECTDFVSRIKQSYLLAGIASLQGRIAGYNAVGGNDKFIDSNPTSIIKVLDVFVGKTGLSLKLARKLGINAAKIELHALDHGGYYPGAQMIHMMLVYNKDDGTIIGFEAIGKSAVDKKTDIISVAIRAKMKVWDLVFLNFCYHPETGSAKDSINILGMIGENIKKGEVSFIDVEELRENLANEELAKAQLLLIDVRTRREFNMGHIDGAINIPLDELRDSLKSIEDLKDRPIVVYCRTSYRSYNAYRILKNAGFKEVFNLNGSYLSWERRL